MVYSLYTFIFENFFLKVSRKTQLGVLLAIRRISHHSHQKFPIQVLSFYVCQVKSPSRLPIPTPPHNFKTALKLIISQSRQPLRQFSFGRIQDSNLQKGFLLLLSFILVGQEGVEPSSSGFSVQRSDRISYQPTYIYNLFFFSYNLYAQNTIVLRSHSISHLQRKICL